MKGLSLEFANKINMYLPFLTQSSINVNVAKSINVAKTNLIIFLFT